MEPKQLPRGVPQGAQPQKQSKRNVPVVLQVSEHTRRIAHELDDRHRDWIVRRKHDDLADILDPTPLEQNPNHIEYLIDFANVDERLAQALERRLTLQHRIAELKRDWRTLLRRYSLEQVSGHIEVLRREWAYVTVLQARLKQASKWSKLSMQNRRQRAEVLDSDNRIASLLNRLAYVARQALQANDIEVLRAGMNDGEFNLADVIDGALLEAAFIVLDDNREARVLVDGFIAHRWEFAESPDMKSQGL